MPIDLVASTDHRGIGSVFVMPDAVAHHRDWRRTLLIVLIGQQAADPRLHAKRPEEISRYILPIARVHGCLGAHSAHAQRRITGLQCGKIYELRCLSAKILVRLPREQRKIAVIALGISAPVTAAYFVSDPPQFTWLGHRQRLQHHLVNQRKDRRRRPDPQCQGNQAGCCKAWSLSQLPQSVTQIGQHSFLAWSFDVAKSNRLFGSLIVKYVPELRACAATHSEPPTIRPELLRLRQGSRSSSRARQCQYAILARSSFARPFETRDSDHPSANGGIRFCCISAQRVIDWGARITRVCIAQPGSGPRRCACPSPGNDSALQLKLFLPHDGSSRFDCNTEMEEFLETPLRALRTRH